jgi:putative salt-induced outer membrane protein
MTTSPRTSRHALLPTLIATIAPLCAQAQLVSKPDGETRSLWGLSASASDGNTRATSVTMTGEAVRQTDESKWGFTGRANYARDDVATTAANLYLGTQYDRNFVDMPLFGFGKLDYLRDRPANIESRFSAYGGLGQHLVRNDEHSWDISAGLGYTEDRYVAPADVAGQLRSRYGRVEAVLSETSTHQLTPTTSARQKFDLYPNLHNEGEYRAVIDLGLAVAITDRLQLTTGLLYRYDSDPGLGLKNYDTLFVTGIAVRFE